MVKEKITSKAWFINGSWVVTIPNWAIKSGLIDKDKDIELRQKK